MPLTSTPRISCSSRMSATWCALAWDLGETAKIALFSVTEGEDKPSKYPAMFRAARLVVFTKLDLLPHVPFDIERATDLARAVNPDLRCLRTSALDANGLSEWYDFLRRR